MLCFTSPTKNRLEPSSLAEALIQKRLQGIVPDIRPQAPRRTRGTPCGPQPFFRRFHRTAAPVPNAQNRCTPMPFPPAYLRTAAPRRPLLHGQSRSHRRNAGTVFFKFGLRAQEHIFFQTLRSVLGGGAQRLHRIHSRALISAHSLERRRLVFGCINSRTVPPAPRRCIPAAPRKTPRRCPAPVHNWQAPAPARRCPSPHPAGAVRCARPARAFSSNVRPHAVWPSGCPLS